MNRADELTRFITSLNNQIDIDFSEIQLIFIDQGNNKNILAKLHKSIELIYISLPEKCSLSHARNLGIPHVKGKFVCFPDDDCWYDKYTLSKVLHFLKNTKYDGVSGIGKNNDGLLTNLFPTKKQEITKTNRCGAISYTMFFRFNKEVLFDENIGVGSKYNLGSGEETDYMLTLLEHFYYKLCFNPEIVVHHPTSNDLISPKQEIEKSYKYARGFGYILRKHKFEFNYIIKHFTRPLAGILYYIFKGDFLNSKRSLYIFKGRIEGFLFKI